MAKYAATTSTSARDSVGELERILERWGCDNFALLKGTERTIVGFRVHSESGPPLTFKLILPVGDWSNQDERSAWRALVMVVKMKLAAIDSGITTLQEEFMSSLLLADGHTVGQHALPQIEHSRVHGELMSSEFSIGASDQPLLEDLR